VGVARFDCGLCYRRALLEKLYGILGALYLMELVRTLAGSMGNMSAERTVGYTHRAAALKRRNDGIDSQDAIVRKRVDKCFGCFETWYIVPLAGDLDASDTIAVFAIKFPAEC